MPTIRTPDGRRLRVPDDATPEQVQAVLQSIGAAPPAAPTPAPAPAPPPGPTVAPPVAAPPPPAIGVPGPAPAPPAPAPAVPEPMVRGGLTEEQRRAILAPVDPTAGMSGMEKFLAGAGQATASTGSGIRQLWNLATGDEEELGRLMEEENERRRLDAPLLRTGAGRAGQITGHIAQAAIPVGAGAKAATTLGKLGVNAATGAGLAALAPTVKGESRGKNVLVGGTVGAVLPAAGKIGSLVNATKSSVLRKIGATLIGSGAERVQAAAGKKIGKLMEGVKVPLAPIKSELESIRKNYSRSLPRDVRDGVDQMITLANNQGKLLGKSLSETRTALLREIGKAAKSDRPGTGLAQTGMERLRRTLDNATDEAIESMPKTLRDRLLGSRAKRLRQAREQYKTGKSPQTVAPYGQAALRGTVESARPGPKEN